MVAGNDTYQFPANENQPGLLTVCPNPRVAEQPVPVGKRYASPIAPIPRAQNDHVSGEPNKFSDEIS